MGTKYSSYVGSSTTPNASSSFTVGSAINRYVVTTTSIAGAVQRINVTRNDQGVFEGTVQDNYVFNPLYYILPAKTAPIRIVPPSIALKQRADFAETDLFDVMRATPEWLAHDKSKAALDFYGRPCNAHLLTQQSLATLETELGEAGHGVFCKGVLQKGLSIRVNHASN